MTKSAKISVIISWVILCTFFCYAANAAVQKLTPKIIINNVSDSPDPFSPNGDGYKDTTTISAYIITSGFNGRLSLIWGIVITGPNGKFVKKFSHTKSIPANSTANISQVWNGAGNNAKIKLKDGVYKYRITARIYSVKAVPGYGNVTLKSSPDISVTVSPDYWNVGSVKVGSITGMNEFNKINVTNKSNCRVSYSLCLINPPGWFASQVSIGGDVYILDAAFSTKPGNIKWSEANHALSIVPVKATSVKFAGDLTGVNASQEEKRPIWLQFKAPKITSVTKEQDIEVIVNAQAV